jgi:D-alanyl-D-alanine carboxypeptidase (penicillin-binding protein 5/6)
VARFVARMNERARRLGLTKTRFANPTGLDARGQVSTARELRALAGAALARVEFARRIALPRATLATASGRQMEIASTNALLGRVEGVRGVKTGTTLRGGECVIALAEREGHQVVVVLLGAKDRWWTAAALIEAAFREARAGTLGSRGAASVPASR